MATQYYPTVASVKQAMREYRRIGPDDFYRIYSNHRRPKSWFVEYKGNVFPVKAVWAAAHRPPAHTRDFQTANARCGLKALGFKDFVSADLAEQFYEGERRRSEINIIARSSRLVVKAKKFHGMKCQACDFDFEAFYGDIGTGYIECHHVDPLSGRDGVNMPTKITDLAMLCANCHRMVHRQTPALTIKELRKQIKISN